MSIDRTAPGVDGLPDVVDAMREWQDDAAPFQPHPGDLGWLWRFGAEATAAAVRTWSRAGRILAAGMLDGSAMLRLAVAPDVQGDEELARALVEDLTRPERGVLAAGKANVEAPAGALIRDLLGARGWGVDEPWQPLRYDLAEPVPDPGVRVEAIGPDRVHLRTAVQRAAFDNSTFSDERWRAMAAGPAYADARCLVAFDERGDAVAAVTVWSAGPGRPGLLEPMGVHREHRGRGYGRAISVAAAGALREFGASSALVCTPSSNVGGVATYRSAGFRPLTEVRDRCRLA
ncbi:GNAT family N-acetyltransferase [Virgisporangium aliadipatigenens]|nr:GNAT family N-acetyltransferase [Virgisporangium aliadipatigenens]